VAKVRVYELAKDLGLESKELLAKLQEVGEFVRSASSTVEAPVVRKLMEKFPDLANAAKAAESTEAPKPAKKAAAKKTAAKKSDGPTPEEIEAALATLDADTRAQLASAQAAQAAAAAAAPVAPVTPVAPSAPTSGDDASAAQMPRPPRPGNNPFSSGANPATAMPRPPRPGNNPFSTGGVVPRPPAQRPLRPGERPPMAGSRPGAVRPGFAARPQARPGTGAPGAAGARPGGSSPYRPGTSAGGAGAPAGNNFGPNKTGGPGRHQRGGAAGAFGKQGNKNRKGRKSKKALREEFDNMAAPSLGGAVVPHGDGKTIIRLRRGATLMTSPRRSMAIQPH